MLYLHVISKGKRLERKLTEQQQKFLDALAGEAQGNIRRAMDIAGYSKSTVETQMYNSLSEEIAEVAQKLLASDSIRAVIHLKNVLDNPEQLGARNKLSAIREILDRAGVVKKEKVEISGNMGGGIFFLPPKQSNDEDEG